jgi:hypothetical protein
VKPLETINVRLSDQEFDFDEGQLIRYNECHEIETFRFIDWEKVTEESVTLPIDKVVVRMLKTHQRVGY